MNAFGLNLSDCDTGIICGWISAYSIDRYGRRILMTFSSSCTLISMLLLALHFWLLDYGYNSSDLDWLMISSLLIFSLMYIGLVPVPSTMLSELFPPDLKSVAGFICSITSAAFAFASARSFQPMMEFMRIQYIFCIYAVVMMICLIYSIVKVPETKGKSLQVNISMISRCNSRKRNSDLDYYPGFST